MSDPVSIFTDLLENLYKIGNRYEITPGGYFLFYNSFSDWTGTSDFDQLTDLSYAASLSMFRAKLSKKVA